MGIVPCRRLSGMGSELHSSAAFGTSPSSPKPLGTPPLDGVSEGMLFDIGLHFSDYDPSDLIAEVPGENGEAMLSATNVNRVHNLTRKPSARFLG